MALTLRKIRVGLVAGVVLLLIVVAAFIAYGRFAARRFWVELPHKLGADIRQETNGFTYSQSLKGRTVFTVHAAREVQRNNGKITLNDVSITLYGRGDGIADRIHGNEFEFDQAAGLLTAVGDVYLDLDAPVQSSAHTKIAVAPPRRTIQVKTSGLIFNQKQQTAETSGLIEFQVGADSGRANGARYDASTGELVLNRAVEMEQERGPAGAAGRAAGPRSLAAGHAVFLRGKDVLELANATYSAGRQTVKADRAQVRLSSDGEPRRIEAEGHVHMASANNAEVGGQRMEADLDEAGRPRTARLAGGVEYAAGLPAGLGASSASGARRGHAAEVRLVFDRKGNPASADLSGGVGLEERAGSAVRTLAAQTMHVAFAEASGGAIARDAVARGGAVLKLADDSAGRQAQTEIRGDQLTAHFDDRGGKPQLSQVEGAGHTVVDRHGADGVSETSAGDTLLVKLDDAAAAGTGARASHGKRQKPADGAGVRSAAGPAGDTGPAAQTARLKLASAVQRGNVTVLRTLPATGSRAADVQRASANEATYDGQQDRLHLNGDAQVEDRDGLLLADAVTLDHVTGDAQAEGHVRASFVQASGDTLHVVAEHAMAHRADGIADFAGTPEKPARMWQLSGAPNAQAPQAGSQGGAQAGLQISNDAGSQVEAAVLHLDRVHRTLTASGPSGSDAPDAVRAVLSGSRSAKPGPVRLSGSRMVYSDQSRTLNVEGTVRLQDRDGVMQAHTATAYLAQAQKASRAATPAASPAAPPTGTFSAPSVRASSTPAAAPFPTGQVERVVARGGVTVEQPGRRATGEQLVYTAADGTFVMTGANGIAPRVVDQLHGSTTGATLRFRTGEDSVVVSAGDLSSGTTRVRSETRAPELHAPQSKGK